MAKTVSKKPSAKPVHEAAPKKLHAPHLPSAPAKPAPATKAPAVAVAPAAPHPKGPPMVVIAGEGTMPLGADNWRRVKRGEPIEVSEDEIAWLERSGVAFKRA